ncbi:hypothetical protein HDV03_000665 [Kappamyces sp. JEL0829]|nr:hypothetical protein HDV03_000665 [Kappamyces sp. JEL0829]
MSQAVSHLALHGISVERPGEALPFLDAYLTEKSRQFLAGGSLVWSPADPQDALLRTTLQARKLEEILKTQETERQMAKDSRAIPMKCLFCKKVPETRSDLFLHLETEHGLFMGQLDNLVFVDEFLNAMNQTLEALLCLYCEKSFPDHVTLRKHMRKKKHFQVNPKNLHYDRFYIKNYYTKDRREPKPDALAGPVLQVNSQLQDLALAEDEDEDGAFEDWQDELDEGQTMCLFDELVYDGPEDCHHHMQSAHGFDLQMLSKAFVPDAGSPDGDSAPQQLDFYERIKLINYIRKMQHSCICFVCKTGFDETEALTRHIQQHHIPLRPPGKADFESVENLFPFFENDPLLMFYDDYEDE